MEVPACALRFPATLYPSAVSLHTRSVSSAQPGSLQLGVEGQTGAMTLDEALQLTQKTAAVEFRPAFSTSSLRDWCELVRDLVAIANSGGGMVVIGLDDQGRPTLAPSGAAPALDATAIDERVHKYTGEHLVDLAVEPAQKEGAPVVAILLGSSRAPLVFTTAGTYPLPGGKLHTAFARGTVYFRHGGKSDVGVTDDLRAAFDRDLAARRAEWLGNIRRVLEAPPGATVQLALAPEPEDREIKRVVVRLTDDPSAPGVPAWNPDETHPFRQGELVAALNARLKGAANVNSFDIQSIRRVYPVDANPVFTHRPRHGSPQYSAAFLDWILEQFVRDTAFFRASREAARARREG
jgi:hypothetical protein